MIANVHRMRCNIIVTLGNHLVRSVLVFVFFDVSMTCGTGVTDGDAIGTTQEASMVVNTCQGIFPRGNKGNPSQRRQEVASNRNANDVKCFEMAVELIIDGYNLLHYAGLGNFRKGPRQFERARDQLLKRLKSRLTEEELVRTTVVFDAQYAEHADRRPMVLYGMSILFSVQGRQADDLIEDILCSSRNPRELRVVSSDQRLRQAARRMRAQEIDSDSFLVELESRAERRDQAKREAELSSEPVVDDEENLLSIEYWLKEFGQIDIESLDRPESHERKVVSGSRDDSNTQEHTPPVQPLQGDSTKGERKKDNLPNDGDPQESSPANELSFWEQRIAEVLKEEAAPPRRKKR